MPDATAILAQMKATCEAATKGPWDEDGDGVTAGDDAVACCIERSADMRFIAAARTGWPRAIRALEVAREALDRIVAETRTEADFITAGRAKMKIDAILEGRDA